jgi:hypothetical protein
MKYLFPACAAAIALFCLSVAGPVQAQDDQELAKESQNPVGNIISVPFENNTNFGVGPEDAVENVLNLKPVYPVNLGRLNLINRFILPVIWQGERVKGEGSEFGLGDFTYQAFLSPAKPGAVIWGAGPAIIVPTHTNSRLGLDKWSAGPAIVVLAKPGPWLVGGLLQHFWSFAGDDDDPDVDLTSFQYFINYNFESGWYLTTAPTITANWEADNNDTWTIPVGGGVGRLVRFGKLPVDFKAVAYWNAEKPDGAADWTLQLQAKFLFPK